MASHRFDRALLAAVAVLAVAGLCPAQAAATPAPPPPPAATDPLGRYQQLSTQADALNEQINNARTQLAAEQALAARAGGDIAVADRARREAAAQEEQYRVQVDRLTAASFEGVRFNQLSALLTGNSARDYLNRAGDLEALAADNVTAVQRLAAAVTAARDAEQRGERDQQTAQDAASAAGALLAQLGEQGQQLNAQLGQVNASLRQLTGAQRTGLSIDIGPIGVYLAPPGVAGAAMLVALDQRGKPYVTAAAGPASFDCSGLVIYAYALAGMPGLPHSSAALSTLGQPVARADLQPGDLVFFGSPVHHVGIYVGGGMMVNAPTTGQVVKVDPLFSDYSGARRLGA